jgi:hypothetical protein
MGVGLPEIECPVPIVGFRPVGLMGESATHRLPLGSADIVHLILKEMEDVATQSTRARTAEEFNEQRKRLYPEYLSLTKAVSGVVLAKMDQCDRTSLMMSLNGMLDSSFTELEDEMETHGSMFFAEELHPEIMVSVATLKSAYMTVPRLFSVQIDTSLAEQDKKLGDDFAVAATWTQFHLEGLKAAMKKNLSVMPEVLQELLEGLRMSVMAYSYVRQAVDLRNLLDQRYSKEFDVTWDEEDDALAHAE